MTELKKSDQHLAVFQEASIRRAWYNEEWWFSVIDVVSVLSNSTYANRYWSDLKRKLMAEAGDGQAYEEIVRLKLTAPDGRQRETDCANTEQLLRIIQSIPSPKAEPFKRWLAKVGYERIQEIADPAQSLDRARVNWQMLGRSEKWIAQRMTGQETRNKLTDYWKTHGVESPDEFALLTNIIHQEWAEVNIKAHKALKNLKTENLRDHMSEAELLFTALAELTTRGIAQSTDASGVPANAKAGVEGGKVAKRAKLDFEKQTGERVVTGDNFLPPLAKSKKLE